jgi:hypothetical protein
VLAAPAAGVGLGLGVREGVADGAGVSDGRGVADAGGGTGVTSTTRGGSVGAGGEVTSTTRGGCVGCGGCVAAGGAVAAGGDVSWTTVTTGVDVAVASRDPLVRFLPNSAQRTMAAMMNEPRMASMRVLKRDSSRSSGPWPGGGGGADGGGGGGGGGVPAISITPRQTRVLIALG